MIHYKIFKTVAELPKSWNDLVAHDILLQTSYLQALENASPSTITLYFIGFFKKENLIGTAIVQRVELYAKDMFRSTSSSKFKAFIKDQISRILKGNILVIGNLTHTGQHGIYFNPKLVTQKDFLISLFDAIDNLKSHIITHKNKSIRTIIFKDYFDEDAIHEQRDLFLHHKFYHLAVQPNMLLHTQTHWESKLDYFSDLNKKYKTRYKRAKKKLGDIKHMELNLENIKENSNRLYALYRNVSNNAAINTFILPEHHFYSLKAHLGENFKIFGYYLNEELIGFYTLILNNESLETYFLGYDREHQYDNQLYLNMLYDMIDFGIKHKMNTIVYARTAMEIKSSVGAKAIAMSIYIKHTNGIINALLRPIFKLMNPEQQWEERHPFKT